MLVLKQREESDLTLEQAQARSLITPGTELYGYCQGYFGRDSYETKIVVEVGNNYLKVKNEHYNVDLQGNESIYESFEITDWVGLVKSSNAALDSGDF